MRVHMSKGAAMRLALIDTGAVTSCARYDVIRRLGVPIEPTRLKGLTGADGKPLTVRGESHISIRIADYVT